MLFNGFSYLPMVLLASVCIALHNWLVRTIVSISMYIVMLDDTVVHYIQTNGHMVRLTMMM